MSHKEHSSHMKRYVFFFYRISSSHIFNSVCWSHALVNGQTSKRPASDGGQCSGQLLMMWSAVCSGSPHSHAALSASPHFFMEALYRPTPVRSLFRVVQCFRLSSSPLTPSSGSDTWRCTRYVMYRLYYIYILYIIYTVTVCMCLDL